MPSNRCRHYRLETELCLIPGAGIALRVPTRRCKLAERMIAHLVKTETGQEVARKLTVNTATTPSTLTVDLAAPPSHVPLLRAIFGPDLEPIHHTDCIVQRCLESCTPSYISLLAQYGLAADAELEAEPDCLESSDYSEDTLIPEHLNTQHRTPEA